MKSNYKHIKLTLAFLLLLFGLLMSYAQNKQILYNWGLTHQSLMLNPGYVVNYDYHYGIPLLSHTHLSAGSSGVTVFDLFANDGVAINTKIDQAISNLDSRDFFTATQQLEIFNFGKRTKNDLYISYGAYQELDVIVYFPKDLIVLAREGNRDFVGYPFDFSDISFRADLLTVFHLGFNQKFSEKLTTGIRFKLYSSMLNFTSTNNSGTFTTTRKDGTVNVYEHSIEDLDVEIKSSGYRKIKEIENDKKAIRNLLGRGLFSGNIGLGVDLGATYQFTDDFTATGSILDLGAIFHIKNTERTTARGDYTYEGVGFAFPDSDNEELPFAGDIREEFEREIPRDTLRTSYTQLRPAKINTGLHYSFGDRSGSTNDCDCLVRTKNNPRRSQIGAQYYAILRPKGPQMAGTIYYSRNFDEGVSVKTSYTVDSYSATNLGVGLAFNLSSVNYYLAADNLLNLANIANANSVSLQFGVNVLVGGGL